MLVDREHALVDLVGDGVQLLAAGHAPAGDGGDAGVREDDVEASVRGDGARERGIHRCGIGDVGDDGADVAAPALELAGDLREAFAVDVGQRDARPAVGQHLGERLADAAGGARDERPLPLHVEQPACGRFTHGRCTTAFMTSAGFALA